MIKVSVYTPTYNYGKFIEESVDSVIRQTMTDWELIIIDDGSKDNTLEILEKYKDHPQITVVSQENKGLNKTNNIAIRLSQGQYIMRLDADDILDENALLVLSNALDKNTDCDLVYPDYYEVDPKGEVLNLVRRKKIGEEVKLLDLPAHGACTMFRRECLMQIGGYLEDFNRQDGYELWLRFIRKHKPYNVNIPLFYYRQHPVSITKRMNKLLDTRREIKRHFVENYLDGIIPKVVGIIPVSNSYVYHFGEPFQTLNNKPLLWYTLNQASESLLLDKVVVATDDTEVKEYVKKHFNQFIIIDRPAGLSAANIKMYEILKFTLEQLEVNHDYTPEAVCTLYINTPLRKAKHIDKSIDTMQVFNVDTVISVQEELAFCYHHRKFGLEPINKSRLVRKERNAIYKENSAIFLSKVETIKGGLLTGENVGHITMLPEESIKITTAYDLWLSEQILNGWNTLT
jgi:glycosyltransferase involved in cell wall biosynthesis